MTTWVVTCGILLFIGDKVPTGTDGSHNNLLVPKQFICLGLLIRYWGAGDPDADSVFKREDGSVFKRELVVYALHAVTVIFLLFVLAAIAGVAKYYDRPGR